MFLFPPLRAHANQKLIAPNLGRYLNVHFESLFCSLRVLWERRKENYFVSFFLPDVLSTVKTYVLLLTFLKKTFFFFYFSQAFGVSHRSTLHSHRRYLHPYAVPPPPPPFAPPGTSADFRTWNQNLAAGDPGEKTSRSNYRVTGNECDF